ncbi:MAG: putative DNA-binding protein [Desulfitobacteriaceae bacterium]
MEKFAKMALLTDFYGPLLTEKQRNIWDLHYQQDFSLAEIAEAESISRQAVHDLIKRTEKILAEYEEKLGLVSRFLQERDKLQEVLNCLEVFQPADFADQILWVRYEQIKEKIGDIFLRFAES